MTPRTPALLALLVTGCSGNPLTNPNDMGIADLTGADLTGADLVVVNPNTPKVHRPTAPMCTAARPAANCNVGDMGFGVSDCNADSVCTAGVNGRCTQVSNHGAYGCQCTYDECQSDSDCASDALCSCRDASAGPGGNRCLPSNCRLDSDCGAGGFCSPSLDPGCGAFFGVTLWRCHTPADTCVNDSDCVNTDGGFGGPPFCGWKPELGHWACSTTQCVG